ncbi:MAG: M28 family peptidase [Gemmatimonadetes bacterium]|nr:M28 family peptidase [Gemmatimonadota bacterium]
MHEHFDGHRAFIHIEKLAAMRRFPGSPGEAQARAYIRGVGDATGVPMREEEFGYSTAPLVVVLPLVCALLGLVSLAGSLLYLWGSRLAIVPGAVLLVLIFVGLRWSAAFETFGARGTRNRSANVVGRIAAAHEPAGTVVLSAHYDAKSQVMPVVVRAGLFIVGFASATVLGLALLIAGALALAGFDVLGSRVAFYLSLLPSVCLFLLVFNFTGNRSAGALDNAAGEAVILEAARVLAENPPGNMDVVVASFGCEEVGLIGSIQYLLAHEEELKSRPCFMLNYDIPFTMSGNLYLNTAFEFPAVETSPRLNALARRAAADMGIEMKGIYMPVGAAADHMPWVKHGIEATGFVSAATYIHSTRDDIDRINREGLRRSGEMALRIVAMLDRRLAEEAAAPQESQPG